MTFTALVVDKDAEGATSVALRDLDLSDLPEGEVTVAVEYSTLNYKDGLCLGPGGGLVRRYPMFPAWIWPARSRPPAIRATPPATRWF